MITSRDVVVHVLPLTGCDVNKLSLPFPVGHVTYCQSSNLKWSGDCILICTFTYFDAVNMFEVNKVSRRRSPTVAQLEVSVLEVRMHTQLQSPAKLYMYL